MSGRMRISCLFFLLFLSAATTYGEIVYGQNVSTFSVGDIRLGAKNSLNDYRCGPSDQFSGLELCTSGFVARRGNRIDTRILRAHDGRALYVNRDYTFLYIAARNSIDKRIDLLAHKFGIKPSIRSTQVKDTHYIIASWGGVTLQRLTRQELSQVQKDRVLGGAYWSEADGLIVDFLTDHSRSNSKQAPIYRLSGTAGYILMATSNGAYTETLRAFAVDAAAITQEIIASTPPPPTELFSSDDSPALNLGLTLVNDAHLALGEQYLSGQWTITSNSKCEVRIEFEFNESLRIKALTKNWDGTLQGNPQAKLAVEFSVKGIRSDLIGTARSRYGAKPGPKEATAVTIAIPITAQNPGPRFYTSFHNNPDKFVLVPNTPPAIPKNPEEILYKRLSNISGPEQIERRKIYQEYDPELLFLGIGIIPQLFQIPMYGITFWLVPQSKPDKDQSTINGLQRAMISSPSKEERTQLIHNLLAACH